MREERGEKGHKRHGKEGAWKLGTAGLLRYVMLGDGGLHISLVSLPPSQSLFHPKPGTTSLFFWTMPDSECFDRISSPPLPPPFLAYANVMSCRCVWIPFHSPSLSQRLTARLCCEGWRSYQGSRLRLGSSLGLRFPDWNFVRKKHKSSSSEQ